MAVSTSSCTTKSSAPKNGIRNISNSIHQGHLSGVGVGVVPIVPRQLEGLHSGTQLEMNVN